MFVSLDFNLSGESLPPINPVTVLQALPSACAGVLAFDILVANSDRHARNLSFRNNQLSMFDHGHALFGCAKGLGLERLSAMEDHLGVTGELPTGGNRHVFLDLLKSDAELAEWMERIGNVPDYVVDDVVDGAEPFGLTADEANTGKSFLKKRRSSLRKMVGDHRGQFRGIAGWSLFP